MDDVRLIDQKDLETSIEARANEALLTREAEIDEKRLDKALKALKSTVARLDKLRNTPSKTAQKDIEWIEENELVPRQRDVDEIRARLAANREERRNPEQNESQRDFLIRTGKITAFGSAQGFVQEKEIERGKERGRDEEIERGKGKGKEKEREKEKEKEKEIKESEGIEIKEEGEIDSNDRQEEEEEEYKYEDEEEEYKYEDEEEEYKYEEDEEDEEYKYEDEEENKYEDGDEDVSHDIEAHHPPRDLDDGDEQHYQKRLKKWAQNRRGLNANSVSVEYLEPHPTIPDAVLNSEYRLPGDIYPALFEYQKTCVQWLWELYTQKAGGIIGDEMGLGKTVQVISFLAGLHHSGLLQEPILVVVPATVLSQWVSEFQRWWPPFRVVILHSIGEGMKKKRRYEEELDTSFSRAKDLVDRVFMDGHVIVTTYIGIKIYSELLLKRKWGYCVLDEGHKIRNPDAEISLVCKRIRTPHRVILSGTPIQNNLVELWSLFDFVFPGRLGTLPVFQQEFAVPINMGGYANASNVQVQTGYKCAVVLRDLVQPYLLRRVKADVAQDLPKKQEMVLFVKLTEVQLALYKRFLESEELGAILGGKRNMLMGVDILRKICNHPNLLKKKKSTTQTDPGVSGKMKVLADLLPLWRDQGHKTLLFSQTRQMLDILEEFVAPSYSYLRMDGSTAIAQRQALIDEFNSDPSIHIFLLTTKVGGLGVNLTGADRVIIYDPDWNPSTDMQARERAWRLGQKKDITIYRLMTAGTIEEKIYHRQIFKTFLTNKILKDPKQRRFFKSSDLHDIFTLGDQSEKGTETGDMFDGKERIYKDGKERRSKRLFAKNDDDFYEVAKINGVSHLDNYEPEENTESSIMDDIFANNVHSTLHHDSLIERGTQEVSLVEKEAARVARAAAEALKQSRKLARRSNIGTPTWTGRFGRAGKAGGLSKPGKSSASIIAELKKKDKPVYEKKSEKDAMMERLVDFFKKKEKASSNDVLRALGVRGEKNLVLLRGMLREVCVWRKEEKMWYLKDL